MPVNFILHQNFPEALEAYSEAIELDGTNMSFVSNRAAVFFEQKDYEACIAEVGRSLAAARVLGVLTTDNMRHGTMQAVNNVL